ncbi:diaminobutyrate acetyltransferase [Amycolatopsis jiangsuensis]|uniref:L-2,4-diaminobutyric acid acetyltransferase n=1 Tax=Amycolatopsis jiangsuensis TaxID=1181879 RepID=A0A840J3B2_9PSEU|nr:diaminobutyrate acetyltransferase [Amycolatopsis jiangsuensis]MBB4687898.1 L-2,4-diaminobutyric acid acetyltransferase [Amycolatopsis jiangsuensis]
MSGKHLIESPTKADGADLWRIARDSQKLDLNSPYAYLLWCRDFAETSVVARVDGAAVGFVIAYRRPSEPAAALVWQVAVDASQRGKGLAGKLLDGLYTRLVENGVRYLETTITPDNEASIRLFTSFAKRWNTTLESSRLLESADFPDDGEGGHEPEDLYRIGPLLNNGSVNFAE